MPSCVNSFAGVSKAHSAPDGFFELGPCASDVHHSASRTLTTNQPSVAGASPEPESSSRASGTGLESRDLEEGANRLAVDPEADHAARAVDLLDRVGRDEAAAPREEPGLDRERIGDVGGGAVHRALDLADDASLPVGDREARSPAEIHCDSAHNGDAIPAVKGNSSRRCKGFVNPGRGSGSA